MRQRHTWLRLAAMFVLAIGLMAAFAVIAGHQPTVDAQSLGGKLPPPGFTFLCRANIQVAATSIGPCNFPPAPAGLQWRKLIIYDYVSGYGGGGDTLGYRFNGDSGANYRQACLTAAAGGTTFAAGTNNGTGTTQMKLAPADSTLTRNVEIEVNNSSEKTEKTAQVLSVTGTGAVGTQASWDLCNGAWVSGASVAITSVTSVTLTNAMGANSGFVVFGMAW